MKHLSGEKTGLKAGLLKNSFILFFLLIPSLSFTQIPINGFCFRNDFPLPKDYYGILPADLNSNGNDELIFYSASNGKIGLYSGIPGPESEFKEFQIKSEISQLKRIKEKQGSSNLFAAVERKLRKVSLFYIFVDSLSESRGEISFDSYPENIFTSDIDLNGTEEILVYGSGFDGLSILYISESGIGERKIITGTSFSEAIFVDLNNDDYPDVLAFDILDNSLRFFINNTGGTFRFSRSIRYSDKLNLLQSLDLNNDGFQEIVYAIDSRIEILSGDARGIYENKTTIKLDSKPSAVQFGDFNNDKIIDLSVSVFKDDLTIFFGKSGTGYFERIRYLKNTLLTFTKFRRGETDNIAAIIEPGKLIVISPEKILFSENKIVLAIKAGAVKKFDFLGDGIPDISFVDEDDNSLKLILNNSSGIPSTLHSIPLAEDHKKILVDEFFKFRKIFYCYSTGTPLLEVFRYNFNTGKLNRKQLYAPGEILDVAFQRIDSSFVNIFVLYNKQSKMYLGKFENRDLSITFREYPFVDRNISSAELFIDDEPVIYYWKTVEDTLQFKKAEIKSGPNVYELLFEIPESRVIKNFFYAADTYNNEYPSGVSVVETRNEIHLLVISGDKFSSSIQTKTSKEEINKELGRAYFGETSIKGIINFTVNSTIDNYINKLIYNEKERTYSLNQMFVAENVSDYFFARLDKKNYYLVYSNKMEGCLSIKSLKK